MKDQETVHDDDGSNDEAPHDGAEPATRLFRGNRDCLILFGVIGVGQALAPFVMGLSHPKPTKTNGEVFRISWQKKEIPPDCSEGIVVCLVLTTARNLPAGCPVSGYPSWGHSQYIPRFVRQ